MILHWILGVHGFEAAKTATWPRRGLHYLGKFIKPQDELAGRGCCCFLLQWHSWAFWAHQEWAQEINRAHIWFFFVLTVSMSLRYLATSSTPEVQIELLHFLEGICAGIVKELCLIDRKLCIHTPTSSLIPIYFWVCSVICCGRFFQSGSHVAWGSFSDAFRGIGGYILLIFFPVFLLRVM